MSLFAELAMFVVLWELVIFSAVRWVINPTTIDFMSVLSLKIVAFFASSIAVLAAVAIADISSAIVGSLLTSTSDGVIISMASIL